MYGTSDWTWYSENGSKKLFNGNWDCTTTVTHVLSNTFQARYVRLVVDQFNGGWPVLRFELYQPEKGDSSGGEPLGIQDTLPNSAFTASSCHGNNCDYYGPQWSRLNNRANYGGWLPAKNVEGEWIQVDLGVEREIGAVATQGGVHGSYWVRSYVLQHSKDGNTFIEYGEKQGEVTVLTGNSDYFTINTNYLEAPFTARYVRLSVRTFNSWPTLRWELYAPEHESLRLGSPYGIADGRIPNNALLASSCHGNDCNSYGPIQSRLLSTTGYGGWIPNFNRAGEWVQVDLGKVTEVGGVATQGRRDGSYWVKSYWVVYSLDESNWQYFMRGNERVIFTGNNGSNGDYNAVVRHVFNPPFLARYVRLVVHSFESWPVLRFEVYAPHKSRDGAPLDNLGKVFGIEDKSLPDDSLTASSTFAAKDNPCAPANARLRSKAGAGGWVAQDSDDKQWLQIATGDEKREVGGLAIQGRASDSQVFAGTRQFVTSFSVSFSKDGSNFEDYKEYGVVKTFRGNIDESSIHKVAFRNPFTAKFVRIHPLSWFGAIAMRVEMYDTARYQAYLAELEETKKAEALKQEAEKARLLAEKVAAEEAARKARVIEEKRKEKEARDKLRAETIAADNAATAEAKAAAAKKVAEAKKALDELENAKALSIANSNKREAELKAKEIEAEQNEQKINALIEEAKAQKAKYVEAQKKLELLNQDFVELRRQGIEALKERTEKLDEISEVQTELTKQQRLLVEVKNELKLLREELRERKKTLLLAHKQAQERAYQAYLDEYNPFRRTGEDNWPFPRKRMCTCKDTDDATMKLEENQFFML